MVALIEIEPPGLGHLSPPNSAALADRDQSTVTNSVGRVPESRVLGAAEVLGGIDSLQEIELVFV